MEKHKLLIIDDDTSILKLLQMRLKDYYQVITTNKPNKAIEIINSDNIFCLIVDYSMPEINGLDLIETVRKHPKLKAIPIILLTSYEAFDQSEFIEYAIKKGANIFLTKKELIDLDKEGIQNLLGSIHDANTSQHLKNIEDKLGELL